MALLKMELLKKRFSSILYPKLRDLKKIGYKSLCYGTFINWDPVRQTELIKNELGWKQDEVEGLPEEFSMEKIECRVNGIRDWLKYVKRGFGRTLNLLQGKLG